MVGLQLAPTMNMYTYEHMDYSTFIGWLSLAFVCNAQPSVHACWMSVVRAITKIMRNNFGVYHNALCQQQAIFASQLTSTNEDIEVFQQIEEFALGSTLVG